MQLLPVRHAYSLLELPPCAACLRHDKNAFLLCFVAVLYSVISYDIISYHIISYQIISYHIILYHIISYHIISYHIISYHIMPCHVMSCHSISYHIMSYRIVSYHIISYYIISYHIISHYIIEYNTWASKGLSVRFFSKVSFFGWGIELRGEGGGALTRVICIRCCRMRRQNLLRE